MEKSQLSFAEYKRILKRKHTKRILTNLKENGPSTFHDLSIGLRVNPYVVNYHLKGLKKYGLVEQDTDKIYAITELGLETLAIFDYI